MGVVAVMIYTLTVGLGLIGGSIPPSRGNLLMALPCLVPTIWYYAGFLLYDSNDAGLVLSGTGWASLGLGFFLQHQSVLTAIAANPDALEIGIPISSAALLLFAVGVLLIMVGAALSWGSLVRRARNTTE